MANPYVLEVRPYGSEGSYTDLVPYLTTGGLKWSRNDVDAQGSGRDTQDGIMHRARLAIKIRLDGTCRPLLQEEAVVVLNAILPEWLDVRYFDLIAGAIVTKKMYSNNIPAVFEVQHGTKQYWTGITFPLIEE